MPKDKQFLPGRDAIFVFGSNQAGIHGAGAALQAYKYYSAQWGVGEGLFKQADRYDAGSYALPTKDRHLQTMPLPAIKEAVVRFFEVAKKNPGLKFFVTRLGCGLAGLTDEQMGPLFVGAPSNITLPFGWGKEVYVDDAG